MRWNEMSGWSRREAQEEDAAQADESRSELSVTNFSSLYCNYALSISPCHGSSSNSVTKSVLLYTVLLSSFWARCVWWQNRCARFLSRGLRMNNQPSLVCDCGWLINVNVDTQGDDYSDSNALFGWLNCLAELLKEFGWDGSGSGVDSETKIGHFGVNRLHELHNEINQSSLLHLLSVKVGDQKGDIVTWKEKK